MCIMLISCWKALGSSTINQSPTNLKSFDGRGFHPYGILNDFPIEQEGKMVAIKVEFVDAQLDTTLCDEPHHWVTIWNLIHLLA